MQSLQPTAKPTQFLAGLSLDASFDDDPLDPVSGNLDLSGTGRSHTYSSGARWDGSIEYHLVLDFLRKRSKGSRGSKKREPIRFPALDSKEFDADLYRWMLSVGSRKLNDLVLAGHLTATPAVEELEQAYLDLLFRGRARSHIYMGSSGNAGPSRIQISVRQAERFAHNAACYHHEHWSPDWILKQVTRGRKGGTKPKTRRADPRVSIQDLQGVEGLSKAEQATALGCSTATISRRRRESKSLSPNS